MEKETTTIEIKKDVYDRLAEEKEHGRESFNDVLRRLLEMDDPMEKIAKGKKPNHFEAVIIGEKFRIDESDNQPFIDALDLSDDEKMLLQSGGFAVSKEINGVEVEVSITSKLKVELSSSSKDGLLEKLVKIRPVLEQAVGKLDPAKNFQVSEWYCYCPKTVAEVATEELEKQEE